MQTEENEIKEEKLVTFHIVHIPSKGDVVGVHVGFDNNLKYFRKWGEPYFILRSVNDSPVKLKSQVLQIRDFVHPRSRILDLFSIF